MIKFLNKYGSEIILILSLTGVVTSAVIVAGFMPRNKDYAFRTTTKTIMVQGCEYLVNEYCNDVRCYIDNDIQDMKLKVNGNCGKLKGK